MLNLLGFEIDWWTLWGLLSQGMFFGSFVVQWWKSEKKGKSVLPVEFWYLRMVGSLMLLIYVLARQDLVFLISLLLQMGIYIRNIILTKNESKKD